MSNKIRLIIICTLFVVALLLFVITRDYENKIVLGSQKTVNAYAPFERSSNYDIKNKERYARYYENNKNLDYEEVVTRVNIGLDYGFYNYIKDADLSKGILVLTNKFLKLNKEYVPNDLEEINDKYFISGNKKVRFLRKEAKEAFEKLSDDSIKNKTPVYGQSAFRTYERQDELYSSAIQSYGKEKADLDTARPGHSEHQTGLTIDVSSTKQGNMLSFEKTSSYKWMMDNAYKYGFILRYPKDKENIHGFIYESWHFRYVGVKVAKDMHDNYSDLTYDEYYYIKIENRKS